MSFHLFISYNCRQKGGYNSEVVSEKLIEDGSSILDEWHRRDSIIYKAFEGAHRRMLHTIACGNSFYV